MSWLNFNDSLNSIKGQLTNFASGVLADGITDGTDDSNSKRVEELETLVSNQISEIETLRKQNQQLQDKLSTQRRSLNGSNEPEKRDDWFWDPYGADQEESDEKNSDPITELRRKVKDLENEKKELIVSLEQLDLDCQQTTEKIVNLKDALQTDYNALQIKYAELQQENEQSKAKNSRALQELQKEKTSLLKDLEDLKEALVQEKRPQEELESRNDFKSTGICDLQKEVEDLKFILEARDSQIKEYEEAQEVNQEEYRKLASILQGYEDQVTTYKIQFQELQQENNALKTDGDSSAQKLEDLLREKRTQHRRYVDLTTESFKKFMDFDLVVEDKDVISHDNPEISEFITIVEVILKLLLDLKWKTETLKKEVDDLTEEKTKILTDKNYEIEKLISNSEILSQEVITKSQALKHYEAECAELIKNNDLLIIELETYKNNSGLQTISETNEDNLLLLENQLENANKRIKTLELNISDLENSKQEVNVEMQSELEYIKKQLNLTGTELSQVKQEYQELETEHLNLQNTMKKLRQDHDECIVEKEFLNVKVDKIQSEFENTEYKYSEINMDMESLKEENDVLKTDVDDMKKANSKLEEAKANLDCKSELMQNEIDDLKRQLTNEIEAKQLQEVQIRGLSEKLQNAKMAETSLKLQNDTLLKEWRNLAEVKENLDAECKCLKSVEKELEQIKLENERLMKKTEEETGTLELITQLKATNEELKAEVDKKLLDLKSQDTIKNLESQLADLTQEKSGLMKDLSVVKTINEELKAEVDKKLLDLKSQDTIKNLESQLADLTQEKSGLMKDLSIVVGQNQEYVQKLQAMEAHINDLSKSRGELINLVTIKHQESVEYHGEIQRLNQVLTAENEKVKAYEEQLRIVTQKVGEVEELAKKNEEIDKLTDQNNFLREKCEVLAQNLLQEQATVQRVLAEKNHASSEKETSLSKELERLRVHLLEIEETYTKELLSAETRNQEMQAKVNEIEQREKDSSTLYTSVNIRTNQQVETLQNQLQLVTNQRDELRKKMSDAEDQNSKQTTALSNLQFVLEQFQKDKEKDVYHETERIRRQINVEKRVQQELQGEITSLKAQLDESKQGLLAASRLTEQLEGSKQQLTSMKEEVSKLQQKLIKSEEKYDNLISHTDAKVDKLLIKNLVVGFLSANPNFNKDQHQILKLIATVLDFNQQDNEKVHLNKSQGSWLNSILHPQVAGSAHEESLSQAFVRFLENESKPRQLPSLLESTGTHTVANKSGEISETSSRQSPILLSEVVLPTFADFGQNRNSSSILKDVLKNNSS